MESGAAHSSYGSTASICPSRTFLTTSVQPHTCLPEEGRTQACQSSQGQAKDTPSLLISTPLTQSPACPSTPSQWTSGGKSSSKPSQRSVWGQQPVFPVFLPGHLAPTHFNCTQWWKLSLCPKKHLSPGWHPLGVSSFFSCRKTLTPCPITPQHHSSWTPSYDPFRHLESHHISFL